MIVDQIVSRIRKTYYALKDSIQPYKKARWAFFLCLLLTYKLKEFSFDIATYLIVFYLLQLAISYFTPQGVLDIDEDEEQQGLHFQPKGYIGILDHIETDEEVARHEDKPLIWERGTIVVGVGLICSYFRMMEVEVFWPILLIYFVSLVGYTIFKILKTMRRHRYSLADFTKTELILK